MPLTLMLQRGSTAVCRGKWSCSKPLDTSTSWASWGPHFISMWFPSSWNTSLEDPSLVSFTGSVDLKQLDNLKYVLRAGPNDNWTLLTSIQHTSPFPGLRFGPLPERVLALYTHQILEGVAYLHLNRVIHRDLKGNNVMLMPTGIIKLIDFGCARRLSCLNHTASNSGDLLKSVHGTPYWMAPEVDIQFI